MTRFEKVNEAYFTAYKRGRIMAFYNNRPRDRKEQIGTNKTLVERTNMLATTLNECVERICRLTTAVGKNREDIRNCEDLINSAFVELNRTRKKVSEVRNRVDMLEARKVGKKRLKVTVCARGKTVEIVRN